MFAKCVAASASVRERSRVAKVAAPWGKPPNVRFVCCSAAQVQCFGRLRVCVAMPLGFACHSDA